MRACKCTSHVLMFISLDYSSYLSEGLKHLFVPPLPIFKADPIAYALSFVSCAQGLLLETPKKQVKKMQEHPRSNKRDAMAFNERKDVSLNIVEQRNKHSARHSTPPSAPVSR